MDFDDLKNLEADEIFDVRGETCPFPALHSKKKLSRLAVGMVLEILIDHPPAAEETLPGLCADNDWPYLLEKESNYWRIKVKKTC